MGFSFEAVDALDYEELRPGYSPEAVRWVAECTGIDRNSVVVDLAAGTGHMSRRFDELGTPVIAIEPAGNLRRVLTERSPTVRTVGAVAERIPLGDAGVDLVVAGNAFHHFDEGKAFAELRRILGPGGALALFWARSNGDGDPTLATIGRTVREAVARESPASAFIQAYHSWQEPPERVGGFAVAQRRSFPHTQFAVSARLADLYATSSDVASIPEPARATLLAQVRDLSRGLPEILEIAGTSDVDLLVRDRTPAP